MPRLPPLPSALSIRSRRSPLFRLHGHAAAAATATAAVATCLLLVGQLHHAPVFFAGQLLPRQGWTQSYRRNVLAAAAAVEDRTRIVMPPDVRECPWGVVKPEYEQEVRRCWGPGLDGKVPGYIAELLPRGSEFLNDEPPLRRRWLNRKEAKKAAETDPYKVLDVAPDAELREIRKAYLNKAKQLHPDRGGDPEKFHQVLLAWRVLSDEERRKNYDEGGEQTAEVEMDHYILVPEIDVLRQAISMHKKMTWEEGFADLPGMVGKVEVYDTGNAVSQVMFQDGEDTIEAWLPSHCLINVGPDGKVDSFDELQHHALMRVKGSQLMRLDLEKVEYEQVIVWAGGWALMDAGMPGTNVMRDVAFAQGFFTEDLSTSRDVLLDLGCGNGTSSHHFATSGKFGLVYGLDRDSTALQVARAEGESQQIGPEQGFYLLRADAHQLPFQDQMVDFVYWGHGWLDVDRPEEVLQEIMRVLKWGGRLAIATEYGSKLPRQIEKQLQELGLLDTSIYPPRHKVFLNLAKKIRPILSDDAV